MKKMVIDLLEALSNTTDELILSNLQAQLYLSFSLFKVRSANNNAGCIDEKKLLLAVNKFCITPTAEHRQEISKLIEDLKGC